MRSLISKGAKSRFEARRAVICHLPSHPSLDKVIVSMEQEEIKQNVMIGEATPVIRSALVVSAIPAREDKEYYNYEKKGHLSYNCPQPHNIGGS
jgi:cobalamin biosynthesis Co2+ chelatase CbiK